MNFQSMLAKRYIFAKKHHSILTICSIVVALAFMSMLFTGFSTIFSFNRNRAYDKAPYHVQLFAVTKEQADIIAGIEGIESVVLKENPDGGYNAQLMVKKFIDDDEKLLNKAFEAAGLSYRYKDMERYEMNLDLMNYDLVGLRAWYNIAVTIAMFFVFVILLAMAMRLVIDTAFEISSKERERQFGVLQSIGATPGQVVKIITMEGSLLSVIGIPLGLVLGNLIAYVAYQVILGTKLLEAIAPLEKIEEMLHFVINPWAMLASAVTGYVWVWLSAYATGMRIIKMSPMQAITSRSNTVKKVRKFSLYGLLFGWKGKVAARNAHRSPKRFWITVVSLTISIVLFSTSSYALDAYITNYEEYLKAEGITFDFQLGIKATFTGEKGFRNVKKELEDSGYFKNVSVNIGNYAKNDPDENKEFKYHTIVTEYVNQAAYERYFYGEPPVPYEELVASGGYLLLEIPQEACPGKTWEILSETYALDELRGTVQRIVEITPEEYEAMSEEEREQIQTMTETDEVTQTETVMGYYKTEPVEHVFPIKYRHPSVETVSYGTSIISIDLIAPIELYEKNIDIYGDVPGYGMECDLTEHEKYYDAINYLNNHESLSLNWDVYMMNYANRSSFTLTKIIVGFIALMLALISIVNLVNIISTGLLNRRSELASMQCVGMTRGQMYGMIVVECLQYVLTSGIVSSLLAFAVMYGTKLYMKLMLLEELDTFIDYGKPQGTVWLCTAAAMVVALVTALISTGSMQKQTLVDQIRSID